MPVASRSLDSADRGVCAGICCGCLGARSQELAGRSGVSRKGAGLSAGHPRAIREAKALEIADPTPPTHTGALAHKTRQRYGTGIRVPLDDSIFILWDGKLSSIGPVGQGEDRTPPAEASVSRIRWSGRLPFPRLYCLVKGAAFPQPPTSDQNSAQL